MGIRIKGTSSRTNPGKSFNLYARENMENQQLKRNYLMIIMI